MGLTKKGLSACRSFSLSFFSFGRSLNSKTDETFEIFIKLGTSLPKMDYSVTKVWQGWMNPIIVFIIKKEEKIVTVY